MKTQLRSIVLFFVVPFFVGMSSGQANDFNFTNGNRARTIPMGGGIGFTLNPDEFLLALNADYFVTHNFALGPLMQLAVGDNIMLLAPTLNAKGVFDLPPRGFLKRLKPFAQAGLGFAYADVDAGGPFGGPNADDITFLFNLGFGAEIFATNHLSFGSNMLFNVMPARLFNDRFFFSWQFATVKYHF